MANVGFFMDEIFSGKYCVDFLDKILGLLHFDDHISLINFAVKQRL